MVTLFFMGDSGTTVGLVMPLTGDDGVLIDDMLPESLGSEFKAAFIDASILLSDFLIFGFPTSSLTPNISGGFFLPSVNARNASSFKAYLTKPIL